MDPNNEIEQDLPPYLSAYKNAGVHRSMGTSIVPPSTDPASKVFSKDVTINSETGVDARLYIPNPRLYIPNPNGSTSKFPVLVYYHGGAFVLGSAFAPDYHAFCNTLVEKAPTVVISVNYRLAPQHRLPIAHDDSWEALQWVMSRGDSWLEKYGDFEKVFIAGDSAGANISHQMGMRAVDMNIQGIMLIHPFFSWAVTDPVWVAMSPIEQAGFRLFWWTVSSLEFDSPIHNPMVNGGKGTMEVASERVMVCVAEEDPLIDRGVKYHDTLKGSSQWKGKLTFVCSEGEGHVFHLMDLTSPNAVEFIDKLVAFIQKQ